jgi:predicted ester cyclase
MSTKENEAKIRRFFEIFSNVQGDMTKLKTAELGSIFAPNCVIHFTTRDMNFEQFIEYNAAIFTTSPDARFTVDDIFAVENRVVTRYSMKGTFKNAYHGITPTGKQIMIKGASIDKFVKGRVAETWDYPDMLSVMIQLGVIPDLSSKL